MRPISFLFLLCFVCSAAAQTGTWTAFYNADSTLTGYKDQSGMVKIAPKFSGLGSAYRFDHIIAVTEESNGKWQSYYLTKVGKIAGRDSLFFFDNTQDCESEGFIRFHDRKTDRMGLFNRNGDIVIPAGYNAMTRVMNGMLVVLKEAEKNTGIQPVTRVAIITVGWAEKKCCWIPWVMYWQKTSGWRITLISFRQKNIPTRCRYHKDKFPCKRRRLSVVYQL